MSKHKHAVYGMPLPNDPKPKPLVPFTGDLSKAILSGSAAAAKKLEGHADPAKAEQGQRLRELLARAAHLH